MKAKMILLALAFICATILFGISAEIENKMGIQFSVVAAAVVVYLVLNEIYWEKRIKEAQRKAKGHV